MPQRRQHPSPARNAPLNAGRSDPSTDHTGLLDRPAFGPNRTEITLRLDYRRNLDPAWYFHPLQQFAMREMAAFFIDEVLIRRPDA